MDPARLPDDDSLTDPTEVSEVSTPVTPSANASPLLSEQLLPPDPTTVPPKKKKKKKSKKAAKIKGTVGAIPAAISKARSQNGDGSSEDHPQVLCISRNKHWRYISSYHGPWLQLPIELLESLFYLNSDPDMYTASSSRSNYSSPASPVSPSGRFRSFSNLDDISPPESPHAVIPALAVPQSSGKPLPPPIDPGVLRSVTNIRRLIDHATDLSVRASSGVSPVELSSMRNNTSYNGTSLAAAQSLGFNPLGTNNTGGRNTSMSANRVHRLRTLAVQKLARAYMEDEIASSVMVMQGGSVFDDVAERVLKHDPNNAEAKYVHFFHEKIPSSHRQLAESTSTTVLDELISLYPHQLEYLRTRGIVHCFREEFVQATKDFTYALKEARARRRARTAHHNAQNEPRSSKSKRRRGTDRHTTGQAPSDGTSVLEGMVEGADGENAPLHPSVLPDAPEPIETQLLFFRGAAYLQHAVHLIESAIIDLEGVSKPTGLEGADLRLCCLETGRYGGVEIGNPEGPLGPRNGPKVQAYRNVLAAKPFRDQVVGLIKKSMRDHERFLSHFDGGASSKALYEGDIAFQVEYAFRLSEAIRPGNHNNSPPPPFPNMPAVSTTYHPLLVESHFSVLICHLLLADFSNLLPQFAKTAVLVDGVEGYPIFLPPRSMGQAEFIEVLERLGIGWRSGTQPHSLASNHRGKGRLESSSNIKGKKPNGYDDDDDDNYPPPPSTPLPPPSPFPTSPTTSTTTTAAAAEIHYRHDSSHILDCARMLLAPVVKRQKERALQAATDKAAGIKKTPPINIPLHGPRVEIILAWLGAVQLPEIEGA
ncbi:hypothetical protein AGABI1DRAFT_117712 [Agaricus bisporus var. burnettii JB137-S8]|uniref:Uncharacterized protein n=1 Tax=Agaricus bisporus var. burnettii (strain JB137-S8 / ATCC MYA-4627 / FGSC 10392) TaxID=597362 RepID=K5XL60_AGABU|nr:uncharacterized protein AGABI1DRAFT_117712 [Agaricus bisporus var. burnettii JB137-S8]EKM84303.1 hypothetical protein AGABI1DRAFT_117712 [Agaricus bisporus var. burnettii JB137-S8]